MTKQEQIDKAHAVLTDAYAAQKKADADVQVAVTAWSAVLALPDDGSMRKKTPWP